MKLKRGLPAVVLFLLLALFFAGCRTVPASIARENVQAAPWLQFLGRHYWILFLSWLIPIAAFLAVSFPKQSSDNNFQFNNLFTNANAPGRLLLILATLVNAFCFVVLTLAVNDKLIFSRFISGAIFVVGAIAIVISSLGALWKFVFAPATATVETGRQRNVVTTTVHLQSYSIPRQQSVEQGYFILLIAVFAGQLLNVIMLFKTF